jgi:ribosome-associated heat shock protein Hsp15
VSASVIARGLPLRDMPEGDTAHRRPRRCRVPAKIIGMESTRVDRYLWAIRLCKTRSEATDLCRGGHVEVNGRSAKPATSVGIGDTIAARVHGRDRVVEVVRVIDTRVGAPIAAECYLDHSPPAPETDRTPTLPRDRGAGRPTKRERRQLDRWRGGRY